MGSFAESTDGFLARHGVQASAGELEDALVLAIQERKARLHGPDGQEFPAPELQALKEAGVDFEPRYERKEDPLVHSIAAYSAILKTAVTTKALAQAIRRSEGRIRQMLKAREVYGIRPQQEWLIPSFQLHEDRLLPGLGQVVSRLPEDIHPLEVESFFLHPHSDLPDRNGNSLSPRDWLISGGSVVQVAELASFL